jgi:hypothetical protein
MQLQNLGVRLPKREKRNDSLQMGAILGVPQKRADSETTEETFKDRK